MPDITVCVRTRCPREWDCYRARSPWGPWQSAARFGEDDPANCVHFLPLADKPGPLWDPPGHREIPNPPSGDLPGPIFDADPDGDPDADLNEEGPPSLDSGPRGQVAG